jgi:hypothetical protein
MKRDVPVLLTSAIKVSAQQTVLTDSDARLALTLQSIEHWRRIPGVRQVVVCDGSGFDLSAHIKGQGAQGLAECEVLAFTNDAAMVKARGKGFGEGQIVQHALAHSRILAGAPSFAKCTGKLWVPNFADCCAHFNGSALFDFRGGLAPDRIDTRFYMVSRSFYDEHLAKAHQLVNDSAGFHLEHAFLQMLGGMPARSFISAVVPRILGVSGSDGTTAQHNALRLLLWTLRNRWVRRFGFSKG